MVLRAAVAASWRLMDYDEPVLTFILPGAPAFFAQFGPRCPHYVRGMSSRTVLGALRQRSPRSGLATTRSLRHERQGSRLRARCR
jgi:hypothetical protein